MAKIKDATDSLPTPNVIRVGERFMANRPTKTADDCQHHQAGLQGSLLPAGNKPPHGRAVRQAFAVRYDEVRASTRRRDQLLE